MDPSQGILKLQLCLFVCLCAYVCVGLHQVVYNFSPKTAFFVPSGTLCYPSWNAALGGVSTLKARSTRWWHNLYQEALEQNSSLFF